MREQVKVALSSIAARFSDDPPSVDVEALRSRYPAWEAWPVDAQLGLALLAWALGSGFSLPGFKSAVDCLEPSFASAAIAVRESKLPPALREVVRTAFRNASVVVIKELNPTVLYWPVALASCKL